MPTSTISLYDTIEFTKRFISNRPSNLGATIEPAATSANTVAQMMMSPPFAWRWNRVITGFKTLPGQQDYTLFNYQASTAVKLGWLTVDDAGNCQACTTAGTTGVTSPTWNHALNGTTTDGTVVWTNRGLISAEVAGSYTFGWVETSSVQDSKNKWWEMTSKLVLGLESTQSRPLYLAAQSDDGLGNITFRVMPCPDQAYPVVITLQQKAPVFTGTQSLWAPIPDDYSHIYNWGFLSMMLLFADDPRYDQVNRKFVGQLLQVAEGLSETEKNIFLSNWQMVTIQPAYSNERLQQATQGRGT